ncbi:MAG: hypothetical protein WA951_05065 [Leeuwenhoekiella sp.]
MAITILTVVVPILFYFMLRNLGKIDSIFIDDIKQRRIPLFFQVILTGIILFMVIRGYEFPELYSFFLAILISASMAFLASLTNIKISLHMVGVAGVLSFALALSIYYNSNLLMLLSLLFFIMGTVASSRLDQGAHDIKEIIMGVIVGCLPQLAIFFYIL